MRKDLMYILFFMFALLTLSIWNSGYLGLFGLSFAKPLGSNTHRDTVPNRPKRPARRSKTRRRDSEIDDRLYVSIDPRYTLRIGENDRERLVNISLKIAVT